MFVSDGLKYKWFFFISYNWARNIKTEHYSKDKSTLFGTNKFYHISNDSATTFEETWETFSSNGNIFVTL